MKAGFYKSYGGQGLEKPHYQPVSWFLRSNLHYYFPLHHCKNSK